jgi:hypothetical protein
MKQNNYFLFVDDVRNPADVLNYLNYENSDIYRKEGWITVRSHDDFMKHVEEKGIPNFVSYDHNMDDGSYTPLEISSHDSISDLDLFKNIENSKEKIGIHCLASLSEYAKKNSLEMPRVQCHSILFKP